MHPLLRLNGRVLAGLATLLLCGCGNAYLPGRSAADIPAQVNVIKLQTAEMGHIDLHDNEELESSPSQNDEEVIVVAKASVIDQFRNFGYRVIEDDSRPPDLIAKIYMAYQPERWPLVDRSGVMQLRIADVSGRGIFDEYGQNVNPIGLIGAVLGPSRDTFVGDLAHRATQLAVIELRKGTGPNVTQAVAVSPAPAAPTVAYPQPSTVAPAAAAPASAPQMPADQAPVYQTPVDQPSSYAPKAPTSRRRAVPPAVVPAYAAPPAALPSSPMDDVPLVSAPMPPPVNSPPPSTLQAPTARASAPRQDPSSNDLPPVPSNWQSW